jgi:hypothetical protein
MKTLRTMVLALVPLALVLGIATPSCAQDTETLLQAAGSGDLDLVKLLIGMGQSANAADSAGNSALMFAAANGQTEIVEFLIEAGADVDAPNAENWTPLMMAALRGHVDPARALINGGADVSARADIGMTPLILAAASGQSEMVSFLLDNGASSDEATDGFTALIAAQSRGDTALVWKLVDVGAFFTTNPGVLPQLVSNPELEAPDSLGAVAVEGSLVIRFIVDVDGKVEPESAEIIESPHEGLNEAVEQMFLGAVYKPAEFAGKPVRMRIRQSMSFGG